MRVLLLALTLLALPGHAEPLALEIRGHQLRQSLFSVFAQPAEELRIGLSSYRGQSLELSLDGEPAGRRDQDDWWLRAPETPGLYRLKITRPETGERSDLHLWVNVPATELQGEYLEGYRIGRYPQPSADRKNYDPPQGFIRVTQENVNIRLSRHFTLGQFLCKQSSDYPKYVVVQESILLLLERLLSEVNDSGFKVDTFGFISAYRTPWYNKRIGNVPLSRHIYGDAMDIFVDADGDGLMDDLNGDGRRNMDDIRLFYDIVEAVKARPENARLVGGVGKYKKTSRHGGFVHVDTRGYKARW